MKPILLTLALGFLFASFYGQTDTTRSSADSIKVAVQKDVVIIYKETESKIDTLTKVTIQRTDTNKTRINIGKIVVLVPNDEDGDFHIERRKDRTGNKNALTYWSGVDLGLNGFLSSDYSFNLGSENQFLDVAPIQSRVISFNVLLYKARLIGDYVGLATGLGLQWNNWNLDRDYTLQFQPDTLYGVRVEGKGVRKNKLRATYLSVPLMFEFNTSKIPSRSFHISAGVIGRWRIGNMYKQRYRLDDNSFKESIKGDLAFNTWQLDGTVRVGYGWFTLFGTVGLIPVFDTKQGPEVFSWSGGIALRIY